MNTNYGKLTESQDCLLSTVTNQKRILSTRYKLDL